MHCSGFQMQPLTRSKGHSAISKIAYNSRQNIRDEQTGEMKYHHARKADLIDTKIFLPAGADQRLNNISAFANAMERTTDTRIGFSGRLDYPLGVPHELHQEMTVLFCQRNFIAQGIPMIVSSHSGSKRNPDNPHGHFVAWDRPIINGIISYVKSKVDYIDEHGEKIKMIDSPDLTRKGQLKYNPDGTIKMKKGYQRLLLRNGRPYFDAVGRISTEDIRVPVIDETTGKQKMERNGKYLKPVWLRGKVPIHNLDTLGILKKLRTAWQDCQNEVLRRHNIRNRDGSLMQVDLRSTKEREADLPSWLRSIPGVKLGHNKRTLPERMRRNDEIKKHNSIIIPLQSLYRKVSAAQKMEMEKLVRPNSGYNDIHRIVSTIYMAEQQKSTIKMAPAIVNKNENILDMAKQIDTMKLLAVEKIVDTLMKKYPDTNPDQIRADMQNEKEFSSALRLIQDTQEYADYIKLERIQRVRKKQQKAMSRTQTRNNNLGNEMER